MLNLVPTLNRYLILGKNTPRKWFAIGSPNCHTVTHRLAFLGQHHWSPGSTQVWGWTRSSPGMTCWSPRSGSRCCCQTTLWMPECSPLCTLRTLQKENCERLSTPTTAVMKPLSERWIQVAASGLWYWCWILVQAQETAFSQKVCGTGVIRQTPQTLLGSVSTVQPLLTMTLCSFFFH